MKKEIITLLLLACFQLGAQEEAPHVCGTTAADQDMFEDRLLENLATVEAGMPEDRGGTKYVPVFFHLVASTSGVGRGRELKCLEQLCALNTAYAPMDIQFYLKPHPSLGLFDKTINDNAVYTTQDNYTLMDQKRHNNAINYYIVDKADSGSSGPGTVLAYYSPVDDWIVSRRDQISNDATNSTIAHETGHFFSLAHPFKGWESTGGFGPSYPGWPIAPVIAPDGGPVERQNGTNCLIAADKICDTPPDYKFAFLQNDCAPYNGGAKDPIGTLVDPMENNTMSYFDKCSVYVFTPIQMSTINADLNHSSRNYLDNTYTPANTSINTPADLLIAPSEGDTVQYYNSILLQWKPVAGATHYAVEIDDLASFISPKVRSFVTTNTSLLVTTLNANDKFFWRVKPFNDYVGCATAIAGSFATPSLKLSADNIESLNSWQVAPNPVRDDIAYITADAENALTVTVSVVDATGKLVKSLENVRLNENENTVQLPLEGLANGFYLVRIDNGIAQSARKLVIAR